MKKSLIDQEAFQEKMGEWKRENPTTSIYFRPICSSKDNNSDSECETKLKRKSKSSQNSLSVLSKTLGKKGYYYAIGTSWYSWILHIAQRVTPCILFFLVVKTIMSYQIVGAYVSENESEGNITEALQILKQWNFEFKPKYFMTDYSTEEIGTVKTVFSNSH